MYQIKATNVLVITSVIVSIITIFVRRTPQREVTLRVASASMAKITG
jgi:hypothetical protein